MKIKQTLFLNDEEEETVKSFANQLIEEKNKLGASVESGGLKVELEDIDKNTYLFEISRTIGYLQIKRTTKRPKSKK